MLQQVSSAVWRCCKIYVLHQDDVVYQLHLEYDGSFERLDISASAISELLGQCRLLVPFYETELDGFPCHSRI